MNMFVNLDTFCQFIKSMFKISKVGSQAKEARTSQYNHVNHYYLQM